MAARLGLTFYQRWGSRGNSKMAKQFDVFHLAGALIYHCLVIVIVMELAGPRCVDESLPFLFCCRQGAVKF
jgi:hypothetical protein